MDEIYYQKNDKKNKKEGKKNEKNGEQEKKEKKERMIVRTEMKPILQTRNKCAFRGFIISIKSLIAMFKECVEEKKLIIEIPTYFLRQDALEMMFCRVRAAGGFNNNPNVDQFKGAFRKIQANMKIDISEKSNCRMFNLQLPENLFYSDIYFVSSTRARVSLNENIYQA